MSATPQFAPGSEPPSALPQRHGVPDWSRAVAMRWIALLAVGLVAAAPAASASEQVEAQERRPLLTGVVDPVHFGGDETRAALTNTRRAGARFARLVLDWSAVAPGGSRRPPELDARRPDDPLYRWEGFDRQVQEVAAARLIPVATIMGAPRWAWTGTTPQRPGEANIRPNPKEFAQFVTAAARRYGGSFGDLPRVRYWLIWNEPNFSRYLLPQFDDSGRPVSPDLYRALVNSASDALHAVHADNVVIAGGLTPFGQRHEYIDQVAPLAFMRQLLCLSAGERPVRVCRTRVRFDVWGHNPYTTGSPTHSAGAPDDVSLPDLWKMRRVLQAAQRLGTLRSRTAVGFWVTEFSWDTQPPDPKGVPERLHARWVAEALYRMWAQGVTVVTWFQIRDDMSSFAQSGLYFSGPSGIASDRPKLALKAFRFPFVAFRQPGDTVTFWGRSPAGRAAVVVELKKAGPGPWRLVDTLRPNEYGIFSSRFSSTARVGYLRARVVGGPDVALPFSLVVPPDRRVCPWGTC